MGTGSYIGYQISQIFHTGARAAGNLKDDADKKGDRSGGWINGVVGFMMVAVFRAALAVVLIPVHCVAKLTSDRQEKS